MNLFIVKFAHRCQVKLKKPISVIQSSLEYICIYKRYFCASLHFNTTSSKYKHAVHCVLFSEIQVHIIVIAEYDLSRHLTIKYIPGLN